MIVFLIEFFLEEISCLSIGIIYQSGFAYVGCGNSGQSTNPQEAGNLDIKSPLQQQLMQHRLLQQKRQILQKQCALSNTSGEMIIPPGKSADKRSGLSEMSIL